MGFTPKLIYIDCLGNARSVEGEVGATVMEVAIKQSIPDIVADCGGSCACATCHVYVDAGWIERVGRPSAAEEEMLDSAFEVRPNSRLSCQIKVTSDLDGLIVMTPERQY